MGSENAPKGLALSGRRCLVTGATSGIGLAAAKALASMGAEVIGIGRDPGRAAAACASIREAAARAAAAAGLGEAPVRCDLLDLSSLAAVDRYARDFVSEGREPGTGGGAGTGGSGPRLDVLVECAGFYSDRLTLSADGFEMQFAVNHLAHFLLATRLLPLLRGSSDGRVIVVSSDSHRFGRMDWMGLGRSLGGGRRLLPYVGVLAYGRSKLANALFAAELGRRTAGTSVTSFAADPGLANTEMGLKQGPSLGAAFWERRRCKGTSPEVPAAAIAWLASEPSLAGLTGLYWKDGKAIGPSRRALDPAAAARLWGLSEDFVAAALGRGAES